MHVRRPSVRYAFVLAALCVSAIVVACGFEGIGDATVVVGGVEAGGVEAGSVLDADVDDALLSDEGGNVVDLDSAGIPAEPVDSGGADVCPADSFRCPATGDCVRVCGGCPGAPIRCAESGTCVDECTGCPGRTFECWACSSVGAVVLAKITCEPSPSSCYTAGFTQCDCGRLGGCYGSEQVCLGSTFQGYRCRGCGEAETDGRRCVGNGAPRTCKSMQRTCE